MDIFTNEYVFFVVLVLLLGALVAVQVYYKYHAHFGEDIIEPEDEFYF